MKRTFITVLAAMLFYIAAPAHTIEGTVDNDAEEQVAEAKQKKNVTYNEKGEIIKTGLNLGPLPVVAFDADRGFLLNL